MYPQPARPQTKVPAALADYAGIKRGQLECVLGGAMSISSLLGLAERLFSGETDNSAGTQNVQQQEKPQHLHTQKSRHQREQNSVEGDLFTPSSTTNATNANDNAVALQFERLRLSTFNITATPAATPAASGETPTPSPSAASVAPATTTAPAATSSGTTVPSAGQAQASTASIQPASTGAAASAGSNPDLLQNFNAQLKALGLTPQEIQAFDQAASLIQQFSPAAFQDLLSQLNALANQFASQAAPSAAAASSTTSSATTGATTGTTGGAGAATPGFQLTELSLRFSGVNETIQSGTGAAATTKQVSAYSLQLQEVRVTLSSPATGQVAQLQAPQPAAAKTQTPEAAS